MTTSRGPSSAKNASRSPAPNIRGVSVGAHPGYADLQGFGRRPQALSTAEVEALLIYQVGALHGMEALGRNGLRYPFAPYGLQQDVRAGMAASYPQRAP